MKIILANLLFLLMASASGKTVIKRIDKIAKSSHPKAPGIVTKYLVRQRFYFAAIPWAKKVLAGDKKYINQSFDADLDRIITKTGFASFRKMAPSALSLSKAPAIKFLLARKAFDRKDYKSALAWIKRVPSGHRYLSLIHI